MANDGIATFAIAKAESRLSCLVILVSCRGLHVESILLWCGREGGGGDYQKIIRGKKVDKANIR